jgi:hypothetical protein
MGSPDFSGRFRSAEPRGIREPIDPTYQGAVRPKIRVMPLRDITEISDRSLSPPVSLTPQSGPQDRDGHTFSVP